METEDLTLIGVEHVVVGHNNDGAVGWHGHDRGVCGNGNGRVVSGQNSGNLGVFLVWIYLFRALIEKTLGIPEILLHKK